MPRTIDLIRASKLPSNMMPFAAKGALSVPPDENIEILVYLAKHNKIFADLARMTLAGWDEKSSLAAASNPKTPAEVLEYFVSPENIRPKLLPALLENPSVAEAGLVKFAISASRDSISAMLQSPRVQASKQILSNLRSNPYLKPEENATIAKLLGAASVPAQNSSVQQATESGPMQPPAVASPNPGTESPSSPDQADAIFEHDPAADEAFTAYLAENAAEITAEQNKPFQAVGGNVGLNADSSDPLEAEPVATAAASIPAPTAVGAVATNASGAAAAPARAKAKAAQPAPGHRENSLQKINRLDVKGRIQLALKGNKEERSLLIRDGTKVVALAVLEAPKLSDGEVEKFALQKNVLEAVLRQIPLKRRFMKNYIVVRNLVSNPRTPLDLGLGLMKHLLVQDLKNLSSNKEVSETVRKLALKMYKQKLETANKK